jgi:Uncharacterized conserved protein
MKKDSLGDRMKGYENISRIYLTRRMPMIIRIDGKTFHSFTKGFNRPFDYLFMNCMKDTVIKLCESIQGCKLAYVQSDEISLLITDYDALESQAWFDKNLQKVVSISASIATLEFNRSFRYRIDCGESYVREPDMSAEANSLRYERKLDMALFDSRVFVLPKEEVTNYFIWRQNDATRNAILSIGAANFSNKQLFKKSCDEIQEMLWQEMKLNFNDFPIDQKRGSCCIKETYYIETDKGNANRTRWIIDENIPIFTQNRDYIEQHVDPSIFTGWSNVVMRVKN